ncbi:MAG: hypothetical protein IJX74_01595 [Clostridia bacterium]|nr:hypothetical protein [Clostridia bacterium]
MPALIIVGCIILFFVLLFTVRVGVTIEYKGEFALSVRIFGIKIRILPKKQKKYKFSKYTLKKIRRREAKEAKKRAKAEAAKREKAAEKARRKEAERKRRASMTKAQLKAEKKKKRAERPKLGDIVSLSLQVAKLFFSNFFGKLHIKVARLHVNVATGDAATTAIMYGALYPSAHLLLSGLQKISNVDGLKRADMRITPDYLGEQTTVDLKITFSVNLGGVLGAIFKAGFKFLFGYTKIKPDPDAPKADKTGSIPIPPTPPLPPSPFDKKQPTAKQVTNGEDVTEENNSK